MKIALTGATGLVGYPILRCLKAQGHEVVTLGRTPMPEIPHLRWDLATDPPALDGIDRLVHAAFSHLPGKYRGGEGDDPDGFTRLNLEGTLRLWDAARRSGIHTVFLSSRAICGDYPPGTRLTEDLTPRPDTLYGQVKLEAERALGPKGVSLRATGVYGPPVPGRAHKWTDLFEGFERGETLPPRIGTEVHAHDLAAAVIIALNPALAGGVFNVSDFTLDRRTLLEDYARITGRNGHLPPASDPGTVNAMSTERLRALGWSPMGQNALRETLISLIDSGSNS